MIDFIKIQRAHEMAERSGVSLDTTIHTSTDRTYPKLSLYVTYTKDGIEIDDHSNNLDDLLDYLQGLTGNKHKYEVGQTVFLLHNNKILSAHIIHVESQFYKLDESVQICQNWFYETELYSSREDLIQGQIKYWMSLK